MAIRTEEIISLTEFKRDTTKALKRLKKTRGRQVLTVNGKAEAVVLSAEAYQDVMDRITSLEDQRAVAEALDDLDRGDVGLPLDEAMAQVRKSIAANRRRKR